MTKKVISDAGNTLVPALLALEELGFQISMRSNESGEIVVAERGDEQYIADDPLRVLGLIKLVEQRSWDWAASDEQIDTTIQKYELD